MSDPNIRRFRRMYILVREIGDQVVLFAAGGPGVTHYWVDDPMRATGWPNFMDARTERDRLAKEGIGTLIVALSFDFVKTQ